MLLTQDKEKGALIGKEEGTLNTYQEGEGETMLLEKSKELLGTWEGVRRGQSGVRRGQSEH